MTFYAAQKVTIRSPLGDQLKEQRVFAARNCLLFQDLCVLSKNVYNV